MKHKSQISSSFSNAVLFSMGAIFLLHSYAPLSSHAMAPQQFPLDQGLEDSHDTSTPEDHTEESEQQESVQDSKESRGDRREVRALALHLFNLTYEYNELKKQQGKSLLKSVKKSKVYHTAKLATEFTAKFMANYHLFVPCIKVLTDVAIKHYDFVLGCNSSSTEEAPVDSAYSDWVCSSGSRNTIIFACMIPVGYHFHHKILKMTQIGLAGANRCFDFAINQYDQLKRQPKPEQLHQLEKSIFETAQSLIDQAEIIRTWPPRDRQVLFHLAAATGQLHLMKAVLNPQQGDEKKIADRVDQLIESMCSICHENINQKEGPIQAPIETGCCQQAFHYSCLLDWHQELMNRGERPHCPLCREIKSEGHEDHLLNQLWPLTCS